MKVSLSKKPVMTVNRHILKKDRLVYLLVGPKPVRYRDGKSRIVYIGTTKKGADRIAASAAYRAEDILDMHGFRYMDVHVVSCKSKQGLKGWRYLEEALLAQFRVNYLDLPRFNVQGNKLKFSDKLESLFRRKAIDRVLMHFDGAH